MDFITAPLIVGIITLGILQNCSNSLRADANASRLLKS